MHFFCFSIAKAQNTYKEAVTWQLRGIWNRSYNFLITNSEIVILIY